MSQPSHTTTGSLDGVRVVIVGGLPGYDAAVQAEAKQTIHQGQP